MTEPITEYAAAPKPDLRKIGVVIFIGVVIVGFGVNFAVDQVFENETRGLRRVIALFVTGLIILPTSAIAYTFWGPESSQKLLREITFFLQRPRISPSKPE